MKKLILAFVIALMSWGQLKTVISLQTPFERMHMSEIRYLTRDEVDAALAEIQKEWPAANWIREGFVFKIHGDAAKTKFLHEDGQIY